MERLTLRSSETSHENGVCCTHFKSQECLEVGGNCAYGCKWEEAVWERVAAFEDTGWTPEMLRKLGENAWHLWDFAQAAENMTVGRLKELAEADKDGRCIILPCKVGQRVFALMDTDKHISECEVKRIGMGNEIGFIGLEPIGARGREYGVALNGFGKAVFLTREEAEKALEEREGKKDD